MKRRVKMWALVITTGEFAGSVWCVQETRSIAMHFRPATTHNYKVKPCVLTYDDGQKPKRRGKKAKVRK